MVVDEKLVERKLLLKRVFSRTKLFEMGRSLKLPYFERFMSRWDVDEDDAALEIALNINDAQLQEFFDKYEPRDWAVFRGKYYTFEDGVLRPKGSWKKLQTNIHQAKRRHGKKCVAVLKALVETPGGCGLRNIRDKLGRGIDPLPILDELERLKIIGTSYEGDQYREWTMLEEVSPLVRLELKMALPSPKVSLPARPAKMERVDYVWVEGEKVKRMDKELDEHLSVLLRHRLEETVKFGRGFSAASLASYLQSLFGPVLYFDSLLSIIQQYGLADVEIVHERGKTGMRTGWSLALFGEPGTGKSFSTRDMILGKPDAKVPPHGIPGRNRYCGGMTPARFIRIGQAYAGRTFNFIVPEFNDWFKYCLPYEMLVLLADGSFASIGEIVEKGLDVEVVSFNPESFEFEIEKISGRSRREVDRVIEIETENGKVLQLTPNHPLPVLTEGGRILWRQAKDFHEEDRVITIGKIDQRSSTPITFWELLPKTMRLKLKGAFLAKVRTAIKQQYSTIKNLSKMLGINYTSFCGYISGRNSISFPLLEEVLSRIGFQTVNLPREIEYVSSGASNKLRLPKEVPPMFMYFVGAIAGDGNINQKRMIRLPKLKDQDILIRSLNTVKKLFGIGYVDEKNNTLFVNNVALVKILNKLGVPSGEKASIIGVPPAIFKMSNQHISEYLRGLFDTDGMVRARKTYGGTVQLSTKSEQLARKVQLLLLRFGVISRVSRSRDQFTVNISDRKDVAQFAQEIGFKCTRKKERLTNLLKGYRGNPRTKIHVLPASITGRLLRRARAEMEVSGRIIEEEIPRSSRYAWEYGKHPIMKTNLKKYVNALERLGSQDSQSLKMLKRLVKSPIIFEKIIRKTCLKKKASVYDIIVPQNHSFISMGFIVHNSGMVEPLKLAMERGKIKYEMHREVVGPYRFNSFFSVNYNVTTYGRGYAVTVRDPNFNAIEDRTLCRLHRLTKERYIEIAESQMRLAFGEIDIERGAREIRDHLTLVYAIETGHPLVRDSFPYKPVMITPQVYEVVKRARGAILELIPREVVSFSARLEDRAVRFACAASLLDYFGSDLDYVPVSEDALRFAVRLYVEEASVRSRGEFEPEDALRKVF